MRSIRSWKEPKARENPDASVETILLTVGSQPREQRVFIGTNYDTHSHVIPLTKEAVLRKGYVPIVKVSTSWTSSCCLPDDYLNGAYSRALPRSDG